MTSRICIFLILALAYTASYSQTPQQFSYQAVVRDNNNQLVANRTVGMRISILKDSVNGQTSYTETHMPKTNTLGIVQLNIGGGSVVSGTFASVPWSSGKLYVKTDMDLQGGTNYTTSGTTQLLSVPYSLYASDVPVSKTGDTVTIGKSRLLIPGAQLIAGPPPSGLDNGLIAYYPFNGNANDESGSGNHGTVNRAVLSTDRLGRMNKAYSFDSLQFVEIPNSGNICPFPMTLSLWVYIDSSRLNSLGSLINKYTPASWNGMSITVGSRSDWNVLGETVHLYPFYLNGGSVPNGLIGGYGQDEKIFTIDKVNIGKWFHFSMTVDSTNGKLYLNGKFISSTTWRTPPSAFQNNLTWIIGGRYNRNDPNDKYFKGKIDEVRIYNRVLTANEIEYLANADAN